MISNMEIKRLRLLAKKVAEYADDPVMFQNKNLWERHNDLENIRPMLLVSPEGAWRELIPKDMLECSNFKAREIEWKLLCLIYRYEKLKDDFVISKDWIVHKNITDSGWGLKPRFLGEDEEPSNAWDFDNTLGFLPKVWDDKIKFSGHSCGFEQVITKPADLKKLKFPIVEYHEKKTQDEFAEVQNVFGDILNVRLKGISRVSFHPMGYYTQMRGHQQVFIDMYDEPDMVHEAMSIYEDGYRQLIRQYVDYNLLSLNNDGTYHASGGFGYTSQLPNSDYNPDKIRPCDIWAFAESQEMASVSPQMHEEFVRVYEKRLLEPFGLNGYGCCDPMDEKLVDVFLIPNIRRISISPFANIEKCAPKMGNKYIFSWKPNPSMLAGGFSVETVRNYVEHAIDVTKQFGCVLEIILKDTHTCDSHPERFEKWIDAVRSLIKGNV